MITLQEKTDTVTVGVENVGAEDCIKIKTEEDDVQLMETVKAEQEVSVLCRCVLWCCVCVCACVRACARACVVLYIVFSYTLFLCVHFTSF